MAGVTAAAAQVGGVDQHGVDHQRLAVVVRAQGEADAVFGVEGEAAVN